MMNIVKKIKEHFANQKKQFMIREGREYIRTSSNNIPKISKELFTPKEAARLDLSNHERLSFMALPEDIRDLVCHKCLDHIRAVAYMFFRDGAAFEDIRSEDVEAYISDSRTRESLTRVYRESVRHYQKMYLGEQ